MKAPYRANIISDCGGRDMARMENRVLYWNPDVRVVRFEDRCRTDLEAGGNVLDAMKDMVEPPGAMLCNMSPRDEEGENGSPIVYGRVRGFELVTTAYALPLIRRLVPEVEHGLRLLNDEAFLQEVKAQRTRVQFRGLTVIPHFLAHLRGVAEQTIDLDKVSRPFEYPVVQIEPTIWCIDTIRGRPCNAKLTVLWSELVGVMNGGKVTIGITRQNGKQEKRTVSTYESLADVPSGEYAATKGSSGCGPDRFVEFVRKNGRAAQTLHLSVGDEVRILG